MTISPNLVTNFFLRWCEIYLPTGPTRLQNFIEISWHLICYDKNASAWFFWNTVNFVGFSVIHVSQGSVAIYGWWNI